MEKTERDAVSEASEYNYLVFGNVEVEARVHPAFDVASRILSKAEESFLSFPGDAFIMLAAFYCGIATVESVAAMLAFLRREKPEAAIIDIHGESRENRPGMYVSDMDIDKIKARMKGLTRCGVFLQEVVYESEGTASFVAYTLSPQAIRVTLKILETPIVYPSSVIETIYIRKEKIRRLMVSRWIAYNLWSPYIKHISRFRSYFKMNNTNEKYHHDYLWFSSERDDIKYSTLIQPVILTRDAEVANEKENLLYNITIPFQKMISFFKFSANGEHTARVILIVDREEDLGALATHVREDIPDRFWDGILLTTPGLIATQNVETMYFGINGKFVPRDMIPH